MKHFRNSNVQEGVEINPQKGNFWPTQPLRLKSIWLKSSTLAVSKSVLRLFVIAVDVRLHTKNWPRVSRFWKIWFSQ